MKKQMFFTMLIASCFLTACSSGTPEEIKKQKEEFEQREKIREEKLNNPVVKTIGVFDGCEVKFYERGYTTENFYIARCSNSKTNTTTSFDRTGGKYPRDIPRVSITQEIEEVNKNIDELNKKKSDLVQKQKQEIVDSAKQKLSKEEMEAIGLK